MSHAFIDLIVMNTILPIRFAFEQSLHKEYSQEILELITALPPEKNIIIDKFASIGILAENAFQSQSLLQLKKEYCDAKKCLQCAVGAFLLKN